MTDFAASLDRLFRSRKESQPRDSKTEFNYLENIIEIYFTI